MDVENPVEIESTSYLLFSCCQLEEVLSLCSFRKIKQCDTRSIRKPANQNAPCDRSVSCLGQSPWSVKVMVGQRAECFCWFCCSNLLGKESYGYRLSRNIEISFFSLRANGLRQSPSSPPSPQPHPTSTTPFQTTIFSSFSVFSAMRPMLSLSFTANLSSLKRIRYTVED